VCVCLCQFLNLGLFPDKSLLKNALPIREESGLKSAEHDDDFQLLDRQNENLFQAWDINTGSIVKFFKDFDLLLLEMTVGHSIQHAMNLAIGFRRPNTEIRGIIFQKVESLHGI